MYLGRCETEPEASGGAADEGTDRYSGPPDTTAAGTVSGAGVPSGRLTHIQPHCGPLQWHHPQQGWLAQLPAYSTVSVINLHPIHTHHALQMGFSLIFCQWVYLLLPTGQLWPVWACCMNNWADYSSTRLKRPWQTFWKPWRAQRYVWLQTSMWFTVQPNTDVTVLHCEKSMWQIWFWIITCSIFYFDHHKTLRTCQFANKNSLHFHSDICHNRDIFMENR